MKKIFTLSVFVILTLTSSTFSADSSNNINSDDHEYFPSRFLPNNRINMTDDQIDELIYEQQKQNINIRDKRGCTALHYATQYLLKKDVYDLLKAGADPTVQDQTGTTPLELAESTLDEIENTVLRHADEIQPYIRDGKVIYTKKEALDHFLQDQIKANQILSALQKAARERKQNP